MHSLTLLPVLSFSSLFALVSSSHLLLRQTDGLTTDVDFPAGCKTQCASVQDTFTKCNLETDGLNCFCTVDFFTQFTSCAECSLAVEAAPEDAIKKTESDINQLGDACQRLGKDVPTVTINTALAGPGVTVTASAHSASFSTKPSNSVPIPNPSSPPAPGPSAPNLSAPGPSGSGTAAPSQASNAAFGKAVSTTVSPAAVLLGVMFLGLGW